MPSRTSSGSETVRNPSPGLQPSEAEVTPSCVPNPETPRGERNSAMLPPQPVQAELLVLKRQRETEHSQVGSDQVTLQMVPEPSWVPAQGQAQTCVSLRGFPSGRRGEGRARLWPLPLESLRSGPGSALCICGVLVSSLGVSYDIQSNKNRSQGQGADGTGCQGRL